MPNRMIRDWTDSLRMDGLSAEAERLFVRLIMKADDYGRFHGEARLLKAACFPLADDVVAAQIPPWISELSAKGLVVEYEADGRKLLAIPNYGQRLRTSRAKFLPMPGESGDWLPDFSSLQPPRDTLPQSADNCPRLPATSGDFRLEGKGSGREVEYETEYETEDKSGTPPRGAGEGVKKDTSPTTPEAKRIADLYRRRHATPWSPKEIKAFKEICPIDPDDLDLVIRYTSAEAAKGDNGRHRRDVLTFLNNFAGEVDRAKAWQAKPTNTSGFTPEQQAKHSPEHLAYCKRYNLDPDSPDANQTIPSL